MKNKDIFSTKGRDYSQDYLIRDCACLFSYYAILLNAVSGMCSDYQNGILEGTEHFIQFKGCGR
ncbi:hypothetical protein D3C80_1836930 [compost metagenome]